jgi:Uma2 family endonuclease
MSTKTLMTTPMTMEQFLQLPDEESYRYELWQGELVDVGETIFDHNWTREELVLCLKLFIRRARLGGEALVETGIRFDTHTLARPDLAYWDAPHLATIDRKRSPVDIIPQLLAEVVSPSNSLRRLFRNAEYFLRAGVLVVWVVDFDPFVVHVFEQGKAKRIVRPGERLEAPSVLPGFSEDVARFVPAVG